MILLKLIFLAFFGVCAGGIVAAGVFAFITTIGLVPRLAGKTHTAKRLRRYEDCITVGATVGNLISLYSLRLPVESVLIKTVTGSIFGVFSGIFVGCLVLSLAETLNALPTVNRRIHLAVGMQYVILSLAMGKALGAFCYFYFRMMAV